MLPGNIQKDFQRWSLQLKDAMFTSVPLPWQALEHGVLCVCLKSADSSSPQWPLWLGSQVLTPVV